MKLYSHINKFSLFCISFFLYVKTLSSLTAAAVDISKYLKLDVLDTVLVGEFFQYR